MNKPGEYVLHEATQEQLSSIDNELYLEIKRFRDDTVAAVEKAHAERCCMRCKHNVKLNSAMYKCELWEDQEFYDHYAFEFKCACWKPKEADNADA